MLQLIFLQAELNTSRFTNVLITAQKFVTTDYGGNENHLKIQNENEFIIVKVQSNVTLKVPYGLQSMCKQTCKHLVRSTLYILMYLLIFSQSNS